MNRHISRRSRIFLTCAAGLLVCGFVVLGLELANVTHFFHGKHSVYAPEEKTPTQGGASSNLQKGEPQTQNTTNATQAGEAKSSSGSNPNLTLVDPSGDFVSNHHPNISGSPAPNTITSVCTSTPGATCTISFTKGGVTKSLDGQITDSNGSAYWNWKLQDIDLTTGSWGITATASLDGKTKTTADPMELVIAL